MSASVGPAVSSASAHIRMPSAISTASSARLLGKCL